MRTMRKVAGSVWLWAALVVVGGCGIAECLRQSAYVEQARAKQQIDRAVEIRGIAAQVQTAANGLSSELAAVPQDDETAETMAAYAGVLSKLSETLGLIVERAIAIENGAMMSSQWHEAAAETIGKPRDSISPGTQEEAIALTDFQRRARTIGQLRRTRDVLGNVVSGRRMFSSAGRREGQSSGNGYLTIAGIVTAVIGGGGLLARGRKALKLLTQDVHEAKNEAHGRVADIEARVNAEQEQLVQLTEAVDAIRAQLSTMAVPTPPAPPHPLAPPPVTRA